MHALLSDKRNKIDGFLCPGHVSVIIGYGAFREIAQQYHKPCVVAGFEPLQIIEGLAEICRQIIECRAEAKSIYTAVVHENGNEIAHKIINEVFESGDGLWRGIGNIPKSTLKVREKYSRYDAFKRFGLKEVAEADTTGCHCGEVLCGLMDPPACPLFSVTCTPMTPIGPCMVSSEGTCAAWFKYGRREKKQ